MKSWNHVGTIFQICSKKLIRLFNIIDQDELLYNKLTKNYALSLFINTKAEKNNNI